MGDLEEFIVVALQLKNSNKTDKFIIIFLRKTDKFMFVYRFIKYFDDFNHNCPKIYNNIYIYIIVNSRTQNHTNKLIRMGQLSMTTNHTSNNNKSRSNLV